MKLKLPFGLKDGKLVDISQVQKGLDCNCICPSCGAQLIARKGEHKVHHFAHKKKDCGSSLETAIHIAAKEILERNKKIQLPSVEAWITVLGEKITLYKEQYQYFDNVFLEKRTDDIIPDVIVEVNGKQLFIEIAITHFIDEVKKEKIKELNISTIEIDLSNIDRQLTLTDLEDLVIHDLTLKKWVFNTKQNALRKKIEGLGKKLWVGGYSVRNQMVFGCPLKHHTSKGGHSYANFIYDCW